MSRAQQGQVTDTAAAENTSYNTNAQDAFSKAQGDVGGYASAVGAFGAANPYTAGGPVQTADNQMTADTAAGLAESGGQAVQSAAVRTGQNAGGAIAATEAMNEANDRALVGQEAQQTKDRAAAGTGYGEAVLGATGNVEGMQDTLAQQQGAAAQGALGTQEQAAQTPSFLDELGQGLITGGGQVGAAFAGKGCWIAAELYGGWTDPRTVLVRRWLNIEFSKTWYGEWLLNQYDVWGAPVARAIQTKRRLRRVFQWIFDRALAAAKKWQAVTDGGR